MAKNETKRVVVVADLHCGHRAGLTPPQWMLNPDNPWDAKWRATQEEQWAWYMSTIQKLRPVHLLLVLGDCVEGRGERCDARDIIRRKHREQVDMATFALDQWKAPHIDMVYGTRYHVADYEDDIAAELGADKIGAHDWPEVNGVVFDIKHHVSGSQVPHTRLTALERDRLWGKLWAYQHKQPDSDIVLRAHVHYHRFSGEIINGRRKMGLICPALQGMGSEFGAERCSGDITYGLVVFDIAKDGTWEWDVLTADLPSQVATTTQY